MASVSHTAISMDNHQSTFNDDALSHCYEELLKYHNKPQRRKRAPYEKKEIAGIFSFWFMFLSGSYLYLVYVLDFDYGGYAESTKQLQRALVYLLLINGFYYWFRVRYLNFAWTGTSPHPEHQLPPDIRTFKPPTKKSNFVWRYCRLCAKWIPPRCHHCKLCNVCVLKRDHHCYFVGACIGMKNQRDFVHMLTFASLSIWYFPGMYRYLHSDEHGYNLGYSDYILPVALWRYLISGSIPGHITLIIVYFWCLLPGIGLGPMNLNHQIDDILKGLTAHEYDRGLNVVCKATLNQRIREVFGPWWAVNWLFPLHLFLKEEGDGIHWPYHEDGRTPRSNEENSKNE